MTPVTSRKRIDRAVATFAIIAFSATVISEQAVFAQSVEEMRLTVGKSIVLDYPSDVRQISTSDPAVVDAVAVSTREVLLNAKAAGTATVIIWSREGQRTIYSINVEQNLEPLRRLLKETFPNENILVQSSRDSLLSLDRFRARYRRPGDRYGHAFRAQHRQQPSIAPPPVEKQVLLRVRFAEINRNAATSYGASIFSQGAAGTLGRSRRANSALRLQAASAAVRIRSR
jgi:pilus assembly protein CpaC